MLKLYCFLTFIVWSDVFKVKNTPHNQICITNASVYDTFVVIFFRFTDSEGHKGTWSDYVTMLLVLATISTVPTDYVQSARTKNMLQNVRAVQKCKRLYNNMHEHNRRESSTKIAR